MFKHSQLESVKAALMHPDYAKCPLYLRIQRALRQLILDGALQANNSLPASRALALSLNVSRDTVENAYSLLHAEGYIERQVGSGSFVAEVPIAVTKFEIQPVFTRIPHEQRICLNNDYLYLINSK